MSIRNYVGARYVPKFADPVEWQANTSYEAMVIVTYNNSSYTSKVPVPSTVGNPAENSKYWALTGNYNAQVEQYRQETETVINNLTTLHGQITTEIEALQNICWWGYNKKICIYGDSTTVVEHSWSKYLYNATITNRGIAGIGIQTVESNINNALDLNTFDYIIVAVGVNDWNGSTDLTDVIKSATTICSKVSRSTARLLFITPYYSYFPRTDDLNYVNANWSGTSLEYYIRAINKATNAFGVPTFNPYWTLSINRHNYQNWLLDDNEYHARLHENEAMGKYMANALMLWDFSTTLPNDVEGNNLFVTFDKSMTCNYDNVINYPLSVKGIDFKKTGYLPDSPHFNLTKGTRIKFQLFADADVKVGITIGYKIGNAEGAKHIYAGNDINKRYLFCYEIENDGEYWFNIITKETNTIVVSNVAIIVPNVDYACDILMDYNGATDEDGNVIAVNEKIGTLYMNGNDAKMVCKPFKLTPKSSNLEFAHASNNNIKGIHTFIGYNSTVQFGNNNLFYQTTGDTSNEVTIDLTHYRYLPRF